MKPALNSHLKLLRKLGQRKYREKEQLFMIEGERAVEQVLENGIIEVESVFVEEGKAISYPLLANSFSLLKDMLNELSDTESPQGILAICKMPKPISIEGLCNVESGVIVATNAIQDPGNLGTIIRTASWFGCNAMLFGKGTVDAFNPKVVRSTAGATGVLPYLGGDLNEILEQLEGNDWDVLLLDGNPGSQPINKIPKSKKTVLVVGNEANGIDTSLINPKRKRVLIPSNEGIKTVESLNAAVATSIALWSVNN